MTAYRLIKNTAKAGNAIIGAGCYAAALESHARDDTVIKIGTNMADPWIYYYDMIISKMQDNPCVPKVKSFHIDHSNEYYVCVMERLEESCPNYCHRNGSYDAIKEYLYGDLRKKKFLKIAKNKYPEQLPNPTAMLEVLDNIIRLTDAFTEEDAEDIQYNWDEPMDANKLDMHHGNVMFREGAALVITDPWCNVDMTSVPDVSMWMDENMTSDTGKYEWLGR